MTTLSAAALRLAALIDSSDDAIISEALDGTIETWNRAAQRMFGYAADEIIGRSSKLLVPPEAEDEARGVLARLKQGEAIKHFETTRIAKSGVPVTVALTISPMLGRDGEMVGLSTIARDIGRQKELEREAFRLAAIVDSSDDAIVSKSLDGTIRTWNQAAERMFGWTAAEAVGQSIKILIPEDRLSEEDDVLARVRSGIGVDHFETIRKRKDGTFLNISLTVSPIRNKDGVIIGASKIARDITTQKRLLYELEEASRVKDEFLATLSHELRTPLNAVMGYARMLRSENLTDTRRPQVLEIIERNARVLSQLVSDVLDVSTIVTGKIRLQVEECDLPSLIESAVEVVRPSAEAKRQTISLKRDAGDYRVVGDPDRLRQVFWNLLVNAVKFTPLGGRIEIVLVQRHAMVDVTVSDTGIGIKPEFLPHVFQRFRQGEAGLNRGFGGLGLGLALVRHFVELHGGSVAVSSPGEGQGATFRVTLPQAAPRP
jgi:PAS domain S-box-containing protein